MNIILTIIEPAQMQTYEAILKRLNLKLNLELPGRGTASKSLLARLRLDPKPKCAVLSSAGEESTEKLMRAVRRELYIDAPGNGISIAIPIKSVGGAKTLEYMQGSDAAYATPARAEYDTELIVVIANEGHTDSIMDAALEAGARGGTVLHAKGTAGTNRDRFYNLTISDEKEMLLIVSASKDKAAIMRAILKKCGPATDAGAISFSVPVSSAMGISTGENEEGEEK